MFQRLLNYISLQGQIESFEEIHKSIKQGILFKGTNLWILVCAIVIASVGLNVNSTAVIIGAMLISPLMGPINGLGYSIAIYDMVLFRQSLKNFGFMVVTSLMASTLYFAITPVSTAHSELLARTSPTIYDVLIALFGGFAGIIAISSKQKGNVIPGVAIATALMPPLCAAGYGLATGQYLYFFGAFYLFTINTVCIAYASIAVSQALKFPIRSADISDKKKTQINQIISLTIIIIILPSIYLGYQLVQNEKFRMNVEKYTQDINIFKGNYLLKSDLNLSKKEVKLIYGGSSLTDIDKDSIKSIAKIFHIDSSKIHIEQGLAFNINVIQNKYQTEEASLKQEISRLNSIIGRNKFKSDSILHRLTIGKQLLSELQPLYPLIKTCSYSETFVYKKNNDSISSTNKTAIVVFSAKKSLYNNDRNKIKEWLKKRLGTDTLKIYFEDIK